MNIYTIILFIIPIYLIIDFLYKNLYKRNVLEGPNVVPLLGSLLHIKDNSHLVFQKDSLNSKYNNGKFVRYWFCDTLTLAIFNVDLLREIYIKNHESLNTRVKTPSINIIGNRFRGIVTADENYWQFHRSIVGSSFTNRKVKTLTSSIEKETIDLINYMKFISKSEQPFKCRSNFLNYNSNIIFDYVFSKRIENIYDGVDIQQNKILIAVRELFDFLRETEIKNYLEITRPFYFLWMKLNKHPSDSLKDIIRCYYKEHCETIDLDNARDVLDSMIIEYRKAESVGNTSEEESIIPMTNELVLAGVETNSTTMEWFLLEMANHQEYQTKLYNELVNVLEKDKSSSFINLSNRLSTPFFNACLKEVLRMHPPVPFGVPRQTTKSISISNVNGGFIIPAGTQIIQSLYSIFRDEQYWGTNSNEFIPERFLNNDHTSHYFPYSIGVRNCVGEQFSKDELYNLLTNIILNFKIDPITKGTKINDQPEFGFSLKPIEFNVNLTLRK